MPVVSRPAMVPLRWNERRECPGALLLVSPPKRAESQRSYRAIWGLIFHSRAQRGRRGLLP